MTDRTVVSPSELNAWLTDAIREVVGCEDCTLTWKYRLREPEKHGGCNWSGLNLRLGENTDRDAAITAAGRVEREAFRLFNLEEKPPPKRASPEFKMDMHRRRL